MENIPTSILPYVLEHPTHDSAAALDEDSGHTQDGAPSQSGVSRIGFRV